MLLIMLIIFPQILYSMRENKIRNEYRRCGIGVLLIVYKMQENRLRWFGHVLRREETMKLVKKCMSKKRE